ncbi:MAG: FG-GAP repeat protein, partial [Planctomycetes bacterium]|nr:FG-GAP repeat protein [Planctomycetota bacterium]
IGSRAGLSVAGAGFCGPTWSRVKSWRAGVPDFGLVLLIGTGVDTVYTYAYRVDHELEQPSVGPPIPIKRRRLLVQLGTTGLGFFTIRGPSGSALGLTVHGPADLDGDGLNDLLLGAPYQLDYLDPAGNGQVHVYRGQ